MQFSGNGSDNDRESRPPFQDQQLAEFLSFVTNTCGPAAKLAEKDIESAHVVVSIPRCERPGPLVSALSCVGINVIRSLDATGRDRTLRAFLRLSSPRSIALVLKPTHWPRQRAWSVSSSKWPSSSCMNHLNDLVLTSDWSVLSCQCVSVRYSEYIWSTSDPDELKSLFRIAIN